MDDEENSSSRRKVVFAGALLAASGVALGAFGAHGLRETIGPVELGWWDTGVQYQMWHAVGLLAVGAMSVRRQGLPCALLGVGTIIFSGTLYAMALGAPRWLGMVTPIGGGLMIAGWLVLAWLVRPRAAPR